ncbi:hypothetical protein C8J25_10670 [Sphingomonas faeni]|uniref:Glycoamylase-like domain-containing protein n=1 Tax=Sphingomonas faeni TaxID=185950 RepID=A0A2T5U2U0_9SPHN|nr:glucoamylase family protein [Sphingomonas faeni]PTW45819.1 hypothetical protein C8J25_10670 [Sphingomonas faeni]
MLDRRQFLGTGAISLGGLTAGCTSVGRPLVKAIESVTGTAPSEPPPSANPLIDNLQERAFLYFWDTTDPVTGLALDRWPTPSFSSIAAVGFALTAYPIGVVNGWITREQARKRTLATMEFFAIAPMGPEPTGNSGYKGFFYHFLGITKGQRFARAELSTIDTALLVGGMLFAQSWFDGDHPEEQRIRALADQIYGAVDWTWITPRAPFLSMGWHPESGFIPSDWNIYNEGMLMYLLALGSPTHPLPPSTWGALTAQFEPSWRGDHLHYPPMFVHQYSHVWVDFRGIRDAYITTKGIDYFENSKRATIAQRDYAIANAGGVAGYGPDIWGLTACDGPGDFKATIGGRTREFFSYSERGPGARDDGTLAPTAAVGSIVFAPDLVIPTITAMHDRYGKGIYGKYGFFDAFNPTLTEVGEPLKHGRIVPGVGWVDVDYLGIDQGPIVAMIENWRTGMVWNTMRRNPHIRRGLDRAGFSGGWLARVP